MKKPLLYIIVIVAVIALIALMIGASGGNKGRLLDERITLRKTDKIPYGTYVAYENLKYIFPNASISTDASMPGLWDSLDSETDGQAMIIVTRRFSPSEEEMDELFGLAAAGNHIFISARELPMFIQQQMELRATAGFSRFYLTDSMELKLLSPPYAENKAYKYPGRNFEAQIFKFDRDLTRILGTTYDNEPNFIQLKAGRGYIYLHLAPLAFSNYFLLHKNNIDYFNKALSIMPPNVDRVVWDEYFLNKMPDPNQNRGRWLRVLMKHPPFKWGLLTALFAVIIFVLFEMRRKQRAIPVINKPVNDSLDFVKTIGRLYFDKGDHLNLARKMASYFLEHVRNRFKIGTSKLNDDFVKTLHYKSGYPEAELGKIISFINFIDANDRISVHELTEFHKRLEAFYNTNSPNK